MDWNFFWFEPVAVRNSGHQKVYQLLPNLFILNISSHYFLLYRGLRRSSSVTADKSRIRELLIAQRYLISKSLSIHPMGSEAIVI